MSGLTESAVVVVVPVAEDAVGAQRDRFDGSARRGVPAHVTVLFPFVAPADIDDDVLAGLARALGTVPTFEATWRRTAWFGERVLWVAPEPAEPFRALTSAVTAAFPGYSPYGGEHIDVVPHLTVGIADHDEPAGPTFADLRRAEQEVRPKLPFAMTVTHVQLICGSDSPGSWTTLAQFPLR